MKTFKVYLILIIAVMFIQCKEKTDKDNKANNDPDKKSITSDIQGTINVTVYNSSDDRGLADVDIEIIKPGVANGQDSTNLQGNAILTEVDIQTEYKFEKDGFNSQTVRFMNFAAISEINVYLRPSGVSSTSKHLRGKVHGNGAAVGGVIVTSGNDTDTTNSDGVYSLDITSLDGTFPLQYDKGMSGGSIRMTAMEDTVTVDIYIDGFTTGGTIGGGTTEKGN